MALYGTPTTQQQQGGGMFSGFSAPSALLGAGAGAGAVLTYDAFRKVQTASEVGFWGTLVIGGLNLLEGNSALTSANTAMGQANAVKLGVPDAADSLNIRSSLQNLATAVQNLTPGGYTGVSTSVLPTPSPSVLATVPASNNGILLVAIIAVVAVIAIK